MLPHPRITNCVRIIHSVELAEDVSSFVPSLCLKFFCLDFACSPNQMRVDNGVLHSGYLEFSLKSSRCAAIIGAMIKFLKKICLSLFATLGFISGSQADGFANGEQVVLLHGIARTASHMKSLEKFLAGKGYKVFNLDYPSTKHTLDKLAAIVAADIGNKIRADKPVHFIGYSMGGIIARAVLNKYRPDNLGRVVQLASPNKGSEVADFLKNNWLFEKVYGPAGKQLTTEGAGIDDLLGKVDYELGVVAGNFSIDPVSSSLIPGDDDGKVSVESTRVDGMKDHVLVYASHTFFPQNGDVHKRALEFIRFGKFLTKSN